MPVDDVPSEAQRLLGSKQTVDLARGPRGAARAGAPRFHARADFDRSASCTPLRIWAG